MERIRIFILVFILVFSLNACNSKNKDKLLLISKNSQRIENSIPVIDTSWHYSRIGNTFVWENPDLQDNLKRKLPVYGKKIVVFDDAIISEEDVYYSGLQQASELFDPPNIVEDYERLTLVYETDFTEKKAYSLFCPAFDSIIFPTFHDAEAIINSWGLEVLNY